MLSLAKDKFYQPSGARMAGCDMGWWLGSTWCGTMNKRYTTYPLRTGVSHGQSALRPL